MARTITMLRYRFEEGIWKNSISNENIAQRLGRAFNVNRLYGGVGRQYGFINCRYHNGIVLGYFAQEGTKEIIKYDNNVQPRTSAETSFAHILFALHVSSGIIAIQKTSIVGFEDMVMSDMRKQIPIAVEELMNEVNIPIVRLFLEQDKTEITSDELYEVFQKYKTTSLKVVNLKGRGVPSYEEFKIFNPRVQQDLVYRQIFDEDTDLGLDSLLLKSPDTDNLQDTALARLSTYVGDIKSLTVDPKNNGKEVHLTTKIADRFKIPISSEDEKQPLSVEDIENINSPLTLTLTLQFAQGNISQVLDVLLNPRNFAGNEEKDEEN